MNKRRRKKQEKRDYLRMKRKALLHAKMRQFGKRMAELSGIDSPLYFRLLGISPKEQ